MLKNWLRRDKDAQDVAHTLYLAAVAQARQPLFYATHGVPDTVDGRFDLIVMHVFLLLRPLSKLAEQDGDGELQVRAGTIAQALFDTMFSDMDRSLREMGVSDISVGKRVKHMAKAFYGRVAAYNDGLEGTDKQLSEALRRNLFGTVTPAADNVAAMSDYLRFQAGQMAAVQDDQALKGEILFAPWPGKGVDP